MARPACVRVCVCVCLCVSLATAKEKDDPSLQRGGRLSPPPIKMIIDWSPLAVVEVLLEATSSSKEAPANIGLSQPRKTASRDSEFATPLVTRLLFQRWIAAELLEGIVRSAVLRSKSLELQLRSLEESGAK